MQKIDVTHLAHPANPIHKNNINTITTDVDGTNVPADPVAAAEQAFQNRLRIDAKAFCDLRNALGYIEADGGRPITIAQDDATGEWGVTCGYERHGIQRHFSGRTLEEALDKAGKYYKD